MHPALRAHPGPWTVEDLLRPARGHPPAHRTGRRIPAVDPASRRPAPAGRHPPLRAAGLRPHHRRRTVRGTVGGQRPRPGRPADPDLVVVDAAAAAEAGSILHADDVVVAVEIASPPTRVIDRRTKPGRYTAAGIPHYWRLDLAPAPRLHLGRLEHGDYLDRTVQPGETTALTEPFRLELDPAVLLR
nr:Uma2 family endonuclease [Kitasatospora sp. CB02891]